ncbi:MAG TPA: hypothetical protein VIV66_14065 [Pyrinomonadaceae bacterium]
MKRIFWIITLTALLAASAVSASAPANFAGTWALDKSKSQNLPRQWENAESIVLEIKQDAKQITVETKVAGSQFPSQPATYNLDGSETSMEMQGRMPGKGILKANWSGDGNALDLTTKRSGTGPNGEFSFTSVDKLTLSEGGKVLTDVRHSEGPRGPQDSTLVYTKK